MNIALNAWPSLQVFPKIALVGLGSRFVPKLPKVVRNHILKAYGYHPQNPDNNYFH